MAQKIEQAPGPNAALYEMLRSPIRYRIMVMLTETEASPAQIARDLELPLQNVSYHVDLLKEEGMIEHVRTEVGRGRAHIYKACARPKIDLEEWEQLPLLDREVISTADLQLIVDDASSAVSAGTMEARPNRTMMRYPCLLDAEGLGEVERAALEFMDKALEAEAASAGRAGGVSTANGPDRFNASVSVLAFEVPVRDRST